MLPNFKNRVGAKALQLLICAVAALGLAACGGGGGSPGATGGNSNGNSGTSANAPKISLAITDGATPAVPVTALSGGQKAVVTVTLTTSTGTPVANAIVNFTTSSSDLITFDPVSASALTNDKGVAVVRIAPSSFTAAGALSITASAVVGSATATATANMSVGAAPLTVGTLEFTPVPTGPLPAFSAITLKIPVTNGTAQATSVSGVVLSSLCVGDGKATLVQGSLNAGVLTATYTNNGCLRGTDTITVSIGSSTKSITLAVDSANIGTIQFIGTDLAGQSIVLKGSGGLGRKEAAVVTFRVVDQNNNGLSGVDVSFRATTSTGGLTVLPSKGTTDVNGNVTTTVSSGTIPTPVRVIAEASRNGTNISGLSDSLIISTGLPMQRFMSLSADSFNIEGWSIDNQISNITVALADQFGNKISDGTAINFVTEGGAIGSSAQGACLTAEGSCTVQLKSQNFRPIDGRVTILAFVQGLEDFVDSDGNGQYTCSDWTRPDGATSGPFRPLIDLCSAGEPKSDMGDPFLDAGNSTNAFMGQPSNAKQFTGLDGSYDPAKGDKPFPYQHANYSSAGNNAWGLNYIRASAEITFSGSSPTLKRQALVGDKLTDWVAGGERVVAGLSGPGCSNQTLTFRIADVNNNPMPKGTTIAMADIDKVVPLSVSPNIVPSTNQVGGTYHSVTIKPDAACAAGIFSVLVTTPGGTGTLFSFSTN